MNAEKNADRGSSLRFIESMECFGATRLPDGPQSSYEIKLDGYRLEAVKVGKETTLYSRRGNVLNDKFPYIAAALAKLPAATILDGEVVAIDDQNRSDFNLLQNFRSAEAKIHYYVFDIPVCKRKSLPATPLQKRREILSELLTVNDHVSLSMVDYGHADRLFSFAKKHGLEGVAPSIGTVSMGRANGAACGESIGLIKDKNLWLAGTRRARRVLMP